MNKVRVLPEIVANKIAAGEVVERPASVVKELVENAIDAEGKNIDISVRDDGQYISVTDDGKGMSDKDAQLALHRHTTSKIYDPEDLHNIKTLGFRGEALASIASVSEMVLLTREEEALAGTRVDLRGGNITSVRSAPHTPGTKIEVKHLFFNTPARYKFLKSPRVEMQHIKRVIVLQALVHPEISFRYFYNNQRSLDLTATQDPLERIRSVFGDTNWKDLLQIEWFGEDFSITGFTSTPQNSRKDKKHQFLFVNSRPVVDNRLLYALRLAYQDLIETHRHPFAVIYINIHPELIDVNVHPNKYEIRFKEERQIFEALREAVNNRLLNLKGPETMRVSTKSSPGTPGNTFSSFRPFQKNTIFTNIAQPASSQPHSSRSFPSHFQASDSSFSLAGNLFHTYLLVLHEDELIIIDQHALHEKMLYHQLKEQAQSPALHSELLVPEVMDIELSLQKIFEQKGIPNLKKLGYDIEHFGGNSYIIKTYPSVLKNVDHTTLIRDYLEEISDEESAGKPYPVEQYQEKLLILSCCRKAVKKGAQLKEAEQYELVREYMRSPDKYLTCPHGRPVAMRIDRKEMDKYFHRDY